MGIQVTASKVHLLLECARPFDPATEIEPEEKGEGAEYGELFHDAMRQFATTKDGGTITISKEVYDHAKRSWDRLTGWMAGDNPFGLVFRIVEAEKPRAMGINETGVSYRHAKVKFDSATHTYDLRANEIGGTADLVLEDVETIRPVKTIPGYHVSSYGRVFSDWVPGKRPATRSTVLRPLSPGRLKSGHLVILPGKRSTVKLVHRLVLEAFVGKCPDGFEARHLDDDPENNFLSNLAWGTRSENMKDAYANGHRGDIPRREKTGGRPFRVVCDHKSGIRDWTDRSDRPDFSRPERIPQTIVLAAMVDADAVAVLHSPRDGFPIIYAAKVDLYPWWDQFIAAYGRIGDGSMRPGPWCTHCPARPGCPTNNAEVSKNTKALVKVVNEGMVDATDLDDGRIHMLLSSAERGLKLYRDSLKERVRAGEVIERPDGKTLTIVKRTSERIASKDAFAKAGKLDEIRALGLVNVTEEERLEAKR